MSSRKIIWVKPANQTVPLHAPNPPTDCTSVDQLELTTDQSGVMSTMLPGDDMSVFQPLVDNGMARFQFSRNPPSTDSTEHVGSTYRITLAPLPSAVYDVRLKPGVLTVVDAA